MLKSFSKHVVEIAIGVAIFVVILYFLPSNTLQVPSLDDLSLSGVDLNFVVDSGETALDIAPSALSGTIQTGISLTETSIQTGVLVTTTVSEQVTYQGCQAPRWTRMTHGESLLAYQQNADLNTCHIQRRICDDGILNGTYTQKSCKEYYSDTSQKQEVVSYNAAKIDPLIQPSSSNPIQISSQHGPIPFVDPYSSSVSNTTIQWTVPFITNYDSVKSTTVVQWATPFSDTSSSSNSSNSSVRDGSTCLTPWGTTVKKGQFIKAYRLNNWFTNLPCEVELRYCLQQDNLQGTFLFPSCSYNDIFIEDFFDSYYNGSILSLQQLLNSLYQNMQMSTFQEENDPFIDLDRLMLRLEQLKK